MRDAVDSSYTGRDAYGRDITYDRAQSSETRDAFGRDERGPRRGGYEERDYSPERTYDRDYRGDRGGGYGLDSRGDHYGSPNPVAAAAGFGSKTEEYLMDIREYAVQTRDRDRQRSNRRGGDRGGDQQASTLSLLDDEEIGKRYAVYKKSFVNSMNEKYFKIHSSEEWFREKYHPKESLEFKKQIRDRKSDCLAEFEASLLEGKWDTVNLNEVDGESATDDAPLYGIDLKSNGTNKPNVLFITGVPLDVKRNDLLQLCQQIPGFKYLELSEPRPEKKMVRIGWIVCHEGSDMTVALEAINEKKIESHSLTVLQSGKGISTNLRSITGHANKPSRLATDLEQAKELARHLDEEAEFEPGHGISLLLQHMNPLLESIEMPPNLDADVKDDGRGDVDMEGRGDGDGDAIKEDSVAKTAHAPLVDEADQGINSARVSKELDLVIVYLHKVHFYDYYHQTESTSPEDHTRKGCITTRKPFAKVKDPQSPPYWLQKLDVSLRRNPVPPQEPAVRTDKEMSRYITKEADTKFRCSECQKLFRGDEFVRKHLRSKHPVLVEHLEAEVQFFHNFCAKAPADLYKAPPSSREHHHHGGNHGHGGGRRSYPDRDRDRGDRNGGGGGFHRGGDRGRERGGGRGGAHRGGDRRSYTDLDAQKHQNIVLNYD